ncbi:toll/interleukin-1 receptor domain-containing protein, partial [Paenibacillus sp. NRS-1783]|uniref:toll/interleukin-1 receptor domain-containing protein n=1 Tax=Paenibacillus sp. NRS-1783 TaxID=3233907 RepID=UPI003D281044
YSTGVMFYLSYGERTKEKDFIKAILRKYDINVLIGAGIYVNNNPYNFQMLLYLNFSIDTSEFEDWITIHYPDKKRRFNYFIGDIVESIKSKGYNIATFIDEKTVDLIIVSGTNEIFLFPERGDFDQLWNNDILKRELNVFLSHSSKDKKFVDSIFNELQLREIRAWYDKYEIQPGDSIVDKINEGLSKSDIGIICISKNFLNSPSGWTKSELNYFIQKRMRSGETNFICLNFDVDHDDLPPLVQDYRYIDMTDSNGMITLVDTLKKKIHEHHKGNL